MPENSVLDKMNRSIQRLLFEHPLYDWCSNEDKSIHVLVVGDGACAAAFTDMCLQAGQLPDYMLEITWCTGNTNTRSEYFSARPALCHFVSIDGATDEPEYYARINFCSETDVNGFDCSRPMYAFMAKSDSAENRRNAEMLKEKSEGKAFAAYLDQDEIKLSECDAAAADDRIDDSNSKTRISDPDALERMAFNTHHAWEGFGNIDYTGMRMRYEQPYNRQASLSYALSIPYKLRSIGITANDLAAAAAEYREILKQAEEGDKKKAELFAVLAYLEHRRWILERATEGVDIMPAVCDGNVYDLCIKNRSVKIKKDGKVIMHPCLVKSTPVAALGKAVFALRANWDDESVSTENLDPMDRMSVELHRTMYREAKNLRENRSELENLLSDIEQKCGEDKIIRYYADRYRLCVQNILDFSEPHARQFESYERDLLSRISDEGGKADMAATLDAVSDLLFPAIECNLYRDYKSYDFDMNAAIPFILTGMGELHICSSLGFAEGIHYDNHELFRLVASATALSATALDYILVYDAAASKDILEATLKGISNYLDYHAMDCSIKIHAFVKDAALRSRRTQKLSGVLDKAKEENWIDASEIIGYSDDAELTELIAKTVKNSGAHCFDGSQLLVESPLLNGRIITKILEISPYFEFDSNKRELKNVYGCEYLTYQPIQASLQVEDMFALVNAADKEFNYQDFYDDYQDFWGIYSGADIGNDDFADCANAWTGVCNILSKADEQSLSVSHVSSPLYRNLVKTMLKAMERKGIIKNLVIDEQNRVSARVRDVRALGMLKKAGDMLETYVYFEALKTGYFDDIQTGYKFKWDKGGVDNELDCVLTKGFKSILVECKSTKKTSEDYYLILDSLADHFGVNYRKVLVIVTDTKAGGYDMQVSRGKQMDIITISTRAELEDIGKKLMSLI